MCLKAILVKNNLGDRVPVPCGRCPLCLKRMASAWSFRLMQECKVSISAHWLTLTYDTDHLSFTHNRYKTLNQRHVQLFMKRLRKAHGKEHPKLKYFYVGEYGGQRFRPHYHMTLFNARLELIQPAWQYGSVFFGKVSGASVGYTLKYMMKPGKIPLHKNDDRIPEFRRMSKELGLAYLSPAMCRWHNADLSRLYCLTEDGKKISMPRYYKNKVYDEPTRAKAGALAREKMLLNQAKVIEDAGGLENYDREREDAINQAYQKMYKSSMEGRHHEKV